MENLEVINQLIEEAKEICLAHQSKEAQKEPFNIFRALGIERREVPLCRVLAELIDPNAHDMGAKFLEIFCREILGYAEDINYANAVVIPEYPVIIPKSSSDGKEKNRRIDIHIHLESGLQIPIEAKIDAEDQNCQLKDYYWFCKNKINGEIRKIYYLTLDGHEPSDNSKGPLKKDQYSCISFAFHILRWTEKCLAECDQDAPVRSALLQFREVLQENTDIERQKIAMEASKLINSMTDFEAAKAIAEGLHEKKKEILVRFFMELETQLKECLTDYGYDVIGLYDDFAKAYYDQKTSTWPGIIIPLHTKEYSEQFALRIEVDHRLYFGVCNYCKDSPYGNDNACKNQGAEAEAKQEYVLDKLTSRTKGSSKSSGSFYWWQYLPSRNTQTKGNKHDIDFHAFNDAYKELYNVNGISNAVTAVVQEILDYIKEIELLV